MKKFISIILIIILTPVYSENSIKQNAEEVSQHYFALPAQYDFNHIIKEKISNKIMRQYIMGAQSMLVRWTLKKDALIPMHFHPNEQTTWITSGSVKVTSQGKEFIVKAGEVFIIPANVPHEFLALEDTIDIDFFTPVREDWLTKTANYLK